MRKAMKSALATPDNILRAVGIGSAVAGLILIWVVRRPDPMKRRSLRDREGHRRLFAVLGAL